ncbi:HAL/PAL/TAL family ammonia-lyase [Ethanoligenens sp.]|uniref:HAL/PAL/TAL family ammonia-lyase n=1 Tax=Ethanoligenens sp. TaxID=2099655 RepID=UPI0039ED1B7C
MSTNTLVIDGYSLTAETVRSFLETNPRVVLAPDAEERVENAHRQVEKWLREGERPVYGITTGLGKLKDFRVGPDAQELFQKKILLSHAAGIGEPFDDATVRLSMLLRLNVLCRGNSGVRVDLLRRLLAFLNAGISPVMPCRGSLGVGDLQPMAHLGLALAGEPQGRARLHGEEGTAADLAQKAGLCPTFAFSTREVLAMMSGSTVLLAHLTVQYFRGRAAVDLADAALAFSLEAVRGERNAFDARMHRARNSEEQMRSAENVRRLLTGSKWTTGEGRARLGETRDRVQDAVSIRSSPQIHGAVRDVLCYVRTVLEREFNASTDNPLLFPDGCGAYETLSGGNYHGAILAYCADFLGIVLTDLAAVSERRSGRLLDPTMSYGLPANLAGDEVGLNTGLVLVQADAIALLGEMRVLATPASIGTIPAKGNQEDHNSMGMGGVLKLRGLLDRLEWVLGIELTCAAQAHDLLAEKMDGLPMGEGTRTIQHKIRETVPFMSEDRYTHELICNTKKLVENGSLLESVKPYLSK